VPVQEVPTTDTAGVVGGTEGGIEGGEVGGDIGGIIGGLQAQPLPDLVKIERDLPLPMGSVSQEFPTYPEFAKSRGWEDSLVVRYVIDKRGKVKEVTVITPPVREEFARAAVDAIRHWRFHPFKDENGEAKEVVHELTVEFKIVRSKRR
jgi:TonB family protein